MTITTSILKSRCAMLPGKFELIWKRIDFNNNTMFWLFPVLTKTYNQVIKVLDETSDASCWNLRDNFWNTNKYETTGRKKNSSLNLNDFAQLLERAPAVTTILLSQKLYVLVDRRCLRRSTTSGRLRRARPLRGRWPRRTTSSRARRIINSIVAVIGQRDE